MPPSERTGFELAHPCAHRWPHISIIVASGAAEPKTGDLPDGFRFIREPFSSEVIIDHLQETLPDGQKPEPLKERAR